MYDAIVIGAGPAGYVSAIKMAHLGLKVAVIEKEYAGGTCANKGCIPTKALLSASHLYHDIKSKAKQFGIEVEGLSLNFEKIKKHMEKSVLSSRKGVEYLFKKNKIDYIKGEAKLENPNKVRINDKILEGRNIVLATGSVPSIFPPFSDVPGIWTSDDFFKMEKLPESVVIVGGGVIGIEMATFLSFLGIPVFIVELMEHILPTEDADVANVVKKSLKILGAKIFESSKVIGLDKSGIGFKVTIESPNERFEIEAEKVLIAIGRKPLINDDIKSLGIKVERGIVTDENLRTNIENIYAIGDVRGKIMLAHAGFHEGVVAAKNIARIDAKVDLSAVPSVIFSYPEVTSVGLREKDADPSKIKVSKFPVSANGRANTMAERNGFAKVISDKESGKVLGVSVVGPMATELIMEGVIAVKEGLSIEKIAETIHPHPTLSEILLGAFEEAEGKAIHL
ncbi:dihydrolipoyl dehydrogenase [Kosmotoga sp. DU53]|uniref:dihydrolipoyl dehydrogenase n=1 Tax=Kosmotoga sp. DU53 TaxID=1310160 RepID=UPI0007C4F3D4|nr:dihydrolipoamide dehydrogenase [Kosmotoga sp. DU53]